MTAGGLLLAAGAGSRMGRPKALMCDADGTSWLVRSVAALRDGGCSSVLVVLGAMAGDARSLLTGANVEVVVAHDWQEGLSASLRTGLTALGLRASSAVESALISLVDLPDVDAAVVRHVLARNTGTHVLSRATYGGRPGHPVLLGRDHWAGVIETARGDEGAKGYLSQRQPTSIECGHLAGGDDVDSLGRARRGYGGGTAGVRPRRS